MIVHFYIRRKLDFAVWQRTDSNPPDKIGFEAILERASKFTRKLLNELHNKNKYFLKSMTYLFNLLFSSFTSGEHPKTLHLTSERMQKMALKEINNPFFFP